MNHDVIILCYLAIVVAPWRRFKRISQFCNKSFNNDVENDDRTALESSLSILCIFRTGFCTTSVMDAGLKLIFIYYA